MSARNRYFEDERIETVDPRTLRRLLGYLKPYKLQVSLALLLMSVARLADLLNPILIMLAIDKYIANGNIKGLLMVSITYFLLLAISNIAIKYRVLVTNKIGHNVIKNLRKEVFGHIQKLSFNFFDSLPAGKIITRVMNNVNTLQDLLQNGVINVVINIFTLFIIMIIMFRIHFRLTLIALSVSPILITIVFLLKNKIRLAWREVQKKGSNLNAYIHESITGIKVTQAFVREEKNSSIFKELVDLYKRTWMKAVMLSHSVFPSVLVVNSISGILVYYVGLKYLETGLVTVGTLIALGNYVWRFWQPIIELSNFYNQILIANSAAERVFQVLDTEPAIVDKADAIELPEVKGKVEFKNVTFSYEKDIKVLKKMTFTVEPGETIALVGATGAGKSTIINLLTRFYDIDSGEILIDGIDIRDVTIESLRKQVGVMMQDSFIFSGTVMDNIRYGKLDATDEEVIEAAKTIHADPFIRSMENGYETELNEGGSRLSTGQRQLISFARIILYNPKILILDEATSSIDTQTEILIQKATDVVLKGRTSFVIAHRLSTIRNADRIFVIDDGEIIEAGNHQELINKGGAYYHLYKAQYSKVV
ncbi:MAG TPA: ABC transporter ATP-binding protein [Halanaerobiaceae bacterium]|jgi:ATP-binding cassette subfamily B protein|nr:ABC transporter ATP-binding protein [Halanaerobiaceae bacterium]HOA41005.1 ABC transporter ATP-binding protein [Halanaerobiales bacterium]HPZ63168.1 ABC transporter ATP-binding protein [Halanaerobiales bacterium]HQD04370.1 ABC transporter ATP-binding protein [Halanaerobiales bacterium]